MSSGHSTNMSAESELSRDAIEAKYGMFRKNVLRAYGMRRPMRALDAMVAHVEDLLHGSDLDAPLDRPVFVLGNFRSGTTFLEQVLARHPSLGHFTLTTSAFPRSPRFADVMRRTVPGFASAMVAPHHPNMVIDAASPFEAEAIWRFCRNNLWTAEASNVLDSDFSDPPFERVLLRLIQKQLRLVGRARFINKNPPNTVRLGFLSRLFPDARFVYIVRHPLRMLRSQLDMERALRRVFPDQTGHDYGEAFSNLFVPRAKLFMRTAGHAAIEAACARDPALGLAMSLVDVHRELTAMQERGGLGDRVLTIRYEDLVTSFEPEITKVLTFLGLNDEAGRALARSQARSVDDTLLSRRSPPPTFSPEVLEILRPLGECFGHTMK